MEGDQSDARDGTLVDPVQQQTSLRDEPDAEEELPLLDYHLVISNRSGLTYDKIFNLALILNQVTVECFVGDCLTPSQENLLSLNERQLVIVSDVSDTPHLRNYTTFPFDDPTASSFTDPVTPDDPNDTGIIPPHDGDNRPPLGSWHDFESRLDNNSESDWENDSNPVSGSGYTADNESLDPMDHLSETDFLMQRHSLHQQRVFPASPADHETPLLARTISGVRDQMALELLGPTRRPPVRQRSAPSRLQSVSSRMHRGYLATIRALCNSDLRMVDAPAE